MEDIAMCTGNAQCNDPENLDIEHANDREGLAIEDSLCSDEIKSSIVPQEDEHESAKKQENLNEIISQLRKENEKLHGSLHHKIKEKASVVDEITMLDTTKTKLIEEFAELQEALEMMENDYESMVEIKSREIRYFLEIIESDQATRNKITAEIQENRAIIKQLKQDHRQEPTSSVRDPIVSSSKIPRRDQISDKNCLCLTF